MQTSITSNFAIFSSMEESNEISYISFFARVTNSLHNEDSTGFYSVSGCKKLCSCPYKISSKSYLFPSANMGMEGAITFLPIEMNWPQQHIGFAQDGIVVLTFFG